MLPIHLRTPVKVAKLSQGTNETVPRLCSSWILHISHFAASLHPIHPSYSFPKPITHQVTLNMVISKWRTMQKSNTTERNDSETQQKKAWMRECLVKDRLSECCSKWRGIFFSQRKTVLLVLDRKRAQITESVKEAVKRTNSIPAVTPGGTTKYLQPLDISVKSKFKMALWVQCEEWMTSCEKFFIEIGCIRRAIYAEDYQ